MPSARALREGMPPENRGSFKLLGAGTVIGDKGGFVQANFKNQQPSGGCPPHSGSPQQTPNSQMPPRILQRNERTTGAEQVQSLFHQPHPPADMVSKQVSSTQCQTETSLEFVGVGQAAKAPLGLTADVCVGGTPVRALVGTGATIILIRSDVYSKLVAAPPPTYNGSLETADGRAVSVDGWVTTNLKRGSIDDDIETLIVPELKARLNPAMRSLKENECALALHGDSLWTGPKEGPIVPLHYEPLRT